MTADGSRALLLPRQWSSSTPGLPRACIASSPACIASIFIRLLGAPFANGPHERTVDFEQIDRQMCEGAQRRVARSKVVECDTHTKVTHSCERVLAGADASHCHSFRNLDFEYLCRE